MAHLHPSGLQIFETGPYAMLENFSDYLAIFKYSLPMLHDVFGVSSAFLRDRRILSADAEVLLCLADCAVTKNIMQDPHTEKKFTLSPPCTPWRHVRNSPTLYPHQNVRSVLRKYHPSRVSVLDEFWYADGIVFRTFVIVLC